MPMKLSILRICNAMLVTEFYGRLGVYYSSTTGEVWVPSKLFSVYMCNAK